MTFDLSSLVASLPSQQDQKRREGMEQRRKQLKAEVQDDSVLCTPDPRTLNSMSQCMYMIRCIERGFSKQQITDLFFGDEFAVKMIANVIGVHHLVDKDKDGNWERTDKASHVIGTEKQ